MITERLTFFEERAKEQGIHASTLIVLADLVRNAVMNPLEPTELELGQFQEVTARLHKPVSAEQALPLMAVLAQAASAAPAKVKAVPGVYCVADNMAHEEVWAEVDGSNRKFHCWHVPSHDTRF